jgi:hypothetical protein
MCHINILPKENAMELFIVLTTAVIIILGVMWVTRRDLNLDIDEDREEDPKDRL